MTLDPTATVTILTGPVHSGKTTRLASWIEAARARGTAVDGILAPVGPEGRSLCRISHDECRLLAAGPDTPEETVVRIGPHAFDAEVFSWARERLLDAQREVDHAGIIVVDEVGPLELRGEGLEPAVSRVIDALHGGPSATGPTAATGHAGGDRRSDAGEGVRLRRSAAPSPRLVLVVRESIVDRVIDHYRLGDVDVRPA